MLEQFDGGEDFVGYKMKQSQVLKSIEKFISNSKPLGQIFGREERKMMKKIILHSSFFPIVPISKICRSEKTKKNPVTSPQRRWGCQEGIMYDMYEENNLFSDFIGIHWC